MYRTRRVHKTSPRASLMPQVPFTDPISLSSLSLSLSLCNLPQQLGTHGRGKRKREEMGDLLKRMEKKAKEQRA